MSNIQSWEVEQYAKLINKILYKGQKRESRAGEVYTIFGETLKIDASQGFPLLQGRKSFYKPVLGELAAFLRGPKHIDDFKKWGCNYWDSWGAEKGGEIELDYGNSWRDFNGEDQLAEVVRKLNEDPTDRRMIVSGWRPDRLSKLSLPCCHMLYQWYVNGDKLDMIWYQRSVDTMVGLPSDIILAAAWNAILAQQCNKKPGTLTFMLGDTHIYANHIPGVLDYLRQLQTRAQQGMQVYSYKIAPQVTIDNFVPDMLTIDNYEPMPKIKFELNV